MARDAQILANFLGRKEPGPIVPVFGRFRPKSKLEYFCRRLLSKFRVFLDHFKTDPRDVDSLGISYGELLLGVPFETVQRRSTFRTWPATKITQFRF